MLAELNGRISFEGAQPPKADVRCRDVITDAAASRWKW